MTGPERDNRPAHRVAAQARLRGATVAEIDGPATRRAFYDVLARELRFPDWFGHNLDALRDALTDLSWLPAGEVVLVWDEPAAMEGREPLLAVLADAAAESAAGAHPVRVVLTGRA